MGPEIVSGLIVIAVVTESLVTRWNLRQREDQWVARENEWREERRDLLNRIQAPQAVATQASFVEPSEKPIHIGIFDDAEMVDYQDSRKR